MSFNINLVVLCGVNLTKDAELKHTTDGTPRAVFAVAYNTEWKDGNGQKQTKVEYFNVVYWGKIAEAIAQYLKKGVRVTIKGRLTQRRWDGDDGQHHSLVEIAADTVILPPANKGDSGSPASGPGVQYSQPGMSNYTPPPPPQQGYDNELDMSPMNDLDVPF